MPVRRDAEYFERGHSSPANPHPDEFKEEEEHHVHEWFCIESNFFCTDAECATILNCEDVAKRLNYWFELEKEDYKRRVMMARQEWEEEHDGKDN